MKKPLVFGSAKKKDLLSAGRNKAQYELRPTVLLCSSCRSLCIVLKNFFLLLYFTANKSICQYQNATICASFRLKISSFAASFNSGRKDTSRFPRITPPPFSGRRGRFISDSVNFVFKVSVLGIKAQFLCRTPFEKVRCYLLKQRVG